MTTKRNAGQPAHPGEPAAKRRQRENYEWIGKGTVDDENVDEKGTLVYSGIRIQIGDEMTEIRPGDVVILNGGAEDETWICRVEKLFQSKSEKMLRGRWFYGASELEFVKKQSNNAAEQKRVDELLSQMGENELVLTNVEEHNSVASILEIVTLVYKRPGGKEKGKYVCAYQLDWEDELKSFELSEVMKAGQPKDDMSNDEEEDEDEDDEENDGPKLGEAGHSAIIQESEGGTLREDIQVGEKYQVAVGPFVPNQKVESRNPTRWWKPGCMPEEDLDTLATSVSEAQNPYLFEHSLTNDDPYTPLTTERLNKFMDHFPDGMVPTLSHMSSASRAFGPKFAKLYRECDVDEVFRVLADSGHDPKVAAAKIKKDTDKYCSTWSSTERDIFDQSLRRNQGALRMVAKDLAPTKSMKQVVDYYYRFKIPDLFRIHENKKRSQAVQLMECIDRRRRGLPIVTTSKTDSDDDEPTRSHWQDQPVDDHAQALEERRKSAKKLLLEVDGMLGKEVLTRVAAAVKKIHTSYDRAVKESLLLELQGQPDLQRRFLEFLPRDV